MSKKLLMLACAGLLPLSVQAKSGLEVTLKDIPAGSAIPPKYAFCTAEGASAKEHVKDGGDISPALSWNAGPAGTKSYAVLMHDTDVPVKFDDANKEGKTLAKDFPRRAAFYHWALVDVPATMNSLPEGADSKGIDKNGKKPEKTETGQSGLNEVGGLSDNLFGGYDGPCPPWNDARIHHYHFTVYALDTASLNLPVTYTAKQAADAVKGHVLAQGEAVGTYSTNPHLPDKI